MTVEASETSSDKTHVKPDTLDGRIIIECPRDYPPAFSQQILVIKSGAFYLGTCESEGLDLDAEITETLSVFAFIGIIDLAFGRYVLVGTERELVGTLQSFKIWRITAGKAIFIGTEPDLNNVDAIDEDTLAKYLVDQELLGSVMQTISGGNTYYSDCYDLTHSLQHNYILNTRFDPQFSTIDDRYFFNKKFIWPFLDSPIYTNWLFKIIVGYVGEVTLPITVSQNPEDKKLMYKILLISRTSVKRLGVRYLRRGLDYEGNAANSVEMEQIVTPANFTLDQSVASFVQIRGSVPVVWAQDMDLSYRPEMKVMDIRANHVLESIEKHFVDLENMYVQEDDGLTGGRKGRSEFEEGRVLCVNLLDDQGFEGTLTKSYENSVVKVNERAVTRNEMQYVLFPFNRQGKGDNYKNLERLYQQLQPQLLRNAYFIAEGYVPGLFIPGDLTVSKFQTGILRVSCLDSLDRTNMCCTLVGKNLTPILVYSIIGQDTAEKLELGKDYLSIGMSEFSKTLKTIKTNLAVNHDAGIMKLWANSGDAISMLYAGTPALKSDITRSGKRSWITGRIEDGMSSMKRYYLNNFIDGKKQDGYDLWSGKIENLDKVVLLIAKTNGVKKARWMKRPMLKGGLIGWVLPKFVADGAEPLLHHALDFWRETLKDHVKKENKRSLGHVDSEGLPHSYVGFVVASMKLYAPEKVDTLVQFVTAMVVFVYILVLVKVFQIKGKVIVEHPKLIHEEEFLKLMENDNLDLD
ncbi:Phosphatidylinositide phosphatase SAC1 [Nowakowskiella sp. JEL0407]|nr:Phosphatidylinositide phosphatase SAC1 [Nowakowskiella sp. JEL0407]